MKKGKKYQDSVKLIEANTLYDTNEALDLVEKTAKAKFDETVEMHMKLGVDGRHADQQVRGAIVLPNGTGKSVRVLQRQQVLTMWAKWIWWKRSRRKTGLNSMWSSPRPT